MLIFKSFEFPRKNYTALKPFEFQTKFMIDTFFETEVKVRFASTSEEKEL